MKPEFLATQRPRCSCERRRGVTMRSDVAPAARAVVGLAFLLGGRAFAQDASLDRANLEAAAGRLVFENVLLADPQAFARRTPVRTRDQARTTALAAPASAGDASADREAFDVCRRPRGLPRPRGRSRSAADEANRGGTGKREALGARGIGLALRAVRSSGRRAQLLPRVSRSGEFRADARLRSDGTVEPRRELTEQPRPEGRVQSRRSAL